MLGWEAVGGAGAAAGRVTVPAPAVEANEDYEEEEYDYESLASDDPDAPAPPVTRLQLFEGRRSRRRREAPKVAEEQESRVQYTVCIW